MADLDDAILVSGVKALTGTPAQVSRKLSGLSAERVVALTLEHGDNAAAKALAQTVADIAPLVALVLKRREEDLLLSIVEKLVPSVPLPEHTLTEARMAAQARESVLKSADWLTAAEVAQVAGFSAINPSTQPNKWKKEGLVFAVRHRNADYFPSYALDPSSGYRPARGLAKVLSTFRGKKDDWGVAYWFASVNSFLGGKRPQDLLLAAPDRILAAAEDEVAGVLHG